MITMAGFFMIFGAYLFYRGSVFYASLVYQIPNSIYAYVAIKNHDFLGFIIVVIGVSLALATIYKMHKGEFVKNLGV